MQSKTTFLDVAKPKQKLSAVADIAKKNFADKNKNIRPQPLIF
jgi:hypothetical protein